MEYREVVLVEPGELGVPFGETEFWDFVIVEGQRLGSNEWIPFLEGYDSRDDAAWLSAYNNGIIAGAQNSTALGSPNLFRDRVIDLLESGDFVTGDVVLIRFRLFSDPFATGWGWAIDDLVIQDRSVPVSDFVLEENFTISPNPTSASFRLDLTLESAPEKMQVTIADITGKILMRDSVDRPRSFYSKEYDISALSTGIYIVNILFDKKETISRKLIVDR